KITSTEIRYGRLNNPSPPGLDNSSDCSPTVSISSTKPPVWVNTRISMAAASRTYINAPCTTSVQTTDRNPPLITYSVTTTARNTAPAQYGMPPSVTASRVSPLPRNWAPMYGTRATITMSPATRPTAREAYRSERYSVMFTRP